MIAWIATEPNGSGNGWRVGPAWLGSDASSDETRQAARIIAAAPDLLAACEALASGRNNDAVDMARAALAKAQGK